MSTNFLRQIERKNFGIILYRFNFRQGPLWDDKFQICLNCLPGTFRGVRGDYLYFRALMDGTRKICHRECNVKDESKV